MQTQPNILIFMTDQQRADTIPPYGKAITPNLDRFCKQGLVFSQAYAPAPHCCPSRASFFTGLYPSQHGVWNNVNVGNALSSGLYEGVRLWSEDLREAGYELYFDGKWHVSNRETPADRGFTNGGRDTANPLKDASPYTQPDTYEWQEYEHEQFKQQAATKRSEGEIIRPGYTLYTHYGVTDNPFNDGGVVDQAVESIRTRRTGKPWCHYVGTLGPHDPYFVPQEYLDQYAIEDIELPSSFTDRMEDKPALYRKTRDRFDQLSEQEHKQAIRHYLAFCTYEDALFGKLLDALEESGEAEQTLVIYLSDHGDYAAEHGLWCKGLPCFKGAYHVPLAMRWPQVLQQPGRVEGSFVSLTDFAPTFLEAAAVSTPRRFAGESLMPFIRNEVPSQWRGELFTQSNGNELYGIQRSVMTAEWKYVYNGFDYEELYNLQLDPDEMTNLYGDPEYDEVVRALSQKLWRFARETDDVCVNQYIMTGLAPYGPGIISTE